MSKQTKVKAITATSPIGGTTADLKNKFAAGSIPLDTDFSQLIDIAECGRRAVGQSADQTDNSVGVGLALAPSTDTANMGKLSIITPENSSIIVNSSGISVNPGDCLNNRGNGLGINFGNGVMNSDDNLTVKAGSGITVDANGVSVKAGNGITVDTNGTDVKAGNGITVDTSGVSVKAGASITVDVNGVSVDINSLVDTIANMIIPRGTIVPLYKNETLPDGWAWCDGKNDTPNMNVSNNANNKISILSANDQFATNYWNLDDGEHLHIDVIYTKFIIKL